MSVKSFSQRSSPANNHPLQLPLANLVTRALPVADREAIAVYMPWTGEAIGSVPACTEEDEICPEAG